MRLRGLHPRRFQAGGANLGPTNPNPGPNPWAQQIAALGPQAPQLTGQAAVNALAQRQGMSPAAMQAFLAQQANNPAGMPMGRPPAVPPAAIGGPGGGAGMPPASFGPAGGAGAPGAMMPRPGMGWGAPPGAGPVGVPPMGGTGMAGAGVAPGMPPGGAPAAAGPQAGLMGALAGRGAGAPGAGMPGAAPGGSMFGAAAVPGANPAAQAAMLQGMVNPAMAGMGMGMAKGGSVMPKGGRVSKFDSTKPAPDNLPTSAAGKKMASGGSVDPDACKGSSKKMAGGGSVDPDAKSKGRARTFDSTKPAPDNLPTKMAGKKLAKGGVLRRKPKAAPRNISAQPSPGAFADQDAAAPPPTTPATIPPPGGMMAKGGKVHGPDCDCAQCEGMAKGGKWIAGAIKHPGALHRQLGVPQGEKIPPKKLAKAAQAGGKLGQRARLAQTLKGMRKAKGGECDKMAAGGAAKQRRGFPNTISPPKRMARGGQMRGAGIAQRGTNFSGIY